MKNIFYDDLDSISFDEMLSTLESIAQETQRIDFKRERVGRPQIAHVACSFANADGGIIAIGFGDPVVGKKLELVDKVDISDRERTALVAAINARVNPPLPLEIGCYVSGAESFMVIRVDRSLTAPHEYIRSEFSNLPVRRDTQTGTLRLAEIDALRERRPSAPARSPLGDKVNNPIFLHQSQSAADFSFRTRVTPTTYSLERRIFDGDDDEEVMSLVNDCRGANQTFFASLDAHPRMDGLHFYSGQAFTWQDDEHKQQFAAEQITIDSDGEIRVRFLQNEPNPVYIQYLFSLAATYLLAQRSFYYLGLTPVVNVSIEWRLDERRFKDVSAYYALPEYFRDDWTVDLATESFTDAVINPTILMLRSVEEVVKSAMLRESLERFERDNVADLRSQWQLAP